MKIRTDFVSNSSSSSFVILGKIFKPKKVLDIIKADSTYLERFNKQHDTEYASIDEAIDDYGLDDVVDSFFDLYKVGLDSYYQCFDYDSMPDKVAFGVDPSRMSNNMTLGQFKQSVADKICSLGLEASADDIEFITGGSDANGSRFFGTVG